MGKDGEHFVFYLVHFQKFFFGLFGLFLRLTEGFCFILYDTEVLSKGIFIDEGENSG